MSQTTDTNVFADLSGTVSVESENPYDALIDACANDPKQIQLRYRKHRETRNEQQKAKLISQDFTGFNLDPILVKLLDQKANPDYGDPRNCLVFWARPPQRIRAMVDSIQKELLKIAPSLWLMPIECLHMTVLEVAHSRTEDEISRLVGAMESKIPNITDYTFNHRARLVKPMLSYDTAAIALSFLPAAVEDLNSKSHDDTYSYHHLRRDIFEEVNGTGVDIASRYVVPSSHLTIARFVTQKDIEEHTLQGIDQQKIKTLVKKLEEINSSLQEKLWSKEPGQWTVGEEKGLVCRRGTVWYGGGVSQHEGQGFSGPDSM